MLKDSGAKILLNRRIDDKLLNFHHCIISTYSSFKSPSKSLKFTLKSRLYHLHFRLHRETQRRISEHAAVVNRLFWVKEKFRLDERDVVLKSAPFIFDVSVCQLFRWIPAGARLCLLPPRGEMDPGLIVKTIGQYSSTTADFGPTILNLILLEVEKNKSFNELASLRWMFCGAETLGLNLVKRFRETLYKFNKTTLINAYGPTEAAVDVTYYLCTEDYDKVPIGKPMANVRVFIIDKWGNLQPQGIAGELYIAGRWCGPWVSKQPGNN